MEYFKQKRIPINFYSIEKSSEHPLASAVVQYFKKEDTIPVEITNFENRPGYGVLGSHKNKTYFIGNHKMIESQNLTIDKNILNEIKDINSKTSTVVFFANKTRILYIIAISDKVKDSAQMALSQIKKMGITPYLLTGDSIHVAAAVATNLGIDHYTAEVLPHDKYNFIKKLKLEGHSIAMVGDGINDSQALAEADVSIAMGKGSDIAIDVAQMTLLSSNLTKIPEAIKLSKDTVTTIKQNLFWAFIYNLLALPVAAGLFYQLFQIQINPMIAGGAMAFSSVSVVLNSLRLKRKRGAI